LINLFILVIFDLLFYYYQRDINKVDDTMDEIRDQMDLANEISDAISQPLGSTGLDEVHFLFFVFLFLFFLIFTYSFFFFWFLEMINKSFFIILIL